MASTQVRDNMKQTIETMIEGFNTFDYDKMRGTRTDDFLYKFLPETLEQPARDNESYKEFYDNLFKPTFKKFTVCSMNSILRLSPLMCTNRCQQNQSCTTSSRRGQQSLEVPLRRPWLDPFRSNWWWCSLSTTLATRWRGLMSSSIALLILGSSRSCRSIWARKASSEQYVCWQSCCVVLIS